MNEEIEGTESAEGQSVPEENTQETEATTEAESSTDKPKQTATVSDEDGARKRINKLVWQREEAKREADYWRAQAQVKATQAQPEQKPTNEGRPNVNDLRWKSYEEYNEALAEWTADRKIEARLKAEREQSQQYDKQQRMSTAMQAFNEKAEKAREKYPDYDDLFDSALISESMAEPILGSENGPEIAVYLAKNPDVARKIYRMNQTDAAREIGKIEAKLDDLEESTVSNAPAPMKTVRPKGEVSNTLSDKMDINTWMKMRAKQLGRK